jgi:hypothetical protein
LINQNLHRRPVALDSAQHRQLRLAGPITDWSLAGTLNALFVATAEFADVCREFPIVFVHAGKEEDGSEAIAPLALFGLAQQQNLFLDGGRWRARYMPAILRVYPFCIARLDGQRFAICADLACAALGNSTGQPLFDADGKATAVLDGLQKQLELLETEIQRTRLAGRRLLELGLLREMRFDATLPDGSKHTVDGFLTVDEKKLAEQSDATLAELHRNGLLGLVQMHWLSLGNMGRLVDWFVERRAAAPAPGAAAG